MDKKTHLDFCALVAQAEAAGRKAGEAVVPTPMIVGTAIGLSDRIDPSKPQYYVEDGVCGFAWIMFKGNTPFGRWMKKMGKAKPAYPNGLQVWVSEFGQSMQRKEAYARAYAAVLRAAGIDAYANSRMD